MNNELMECRMAEVSARNAESETIPDNEKRAYSVDDIMTILDISRSSAYILIKKNSFGVSRWGTNSVSLRPASTSGWTRGDCQLYDFRQIRTIAHLSKLSTPTTM